MSAEDNFRRAFERLKAGEPITISKNSLVSQNNVAREAGCDPSALKKSRHPALISEIQEWAKQHGPVKVSSERARSKPRRPEHRNLRIEFEMLKMERDSALSRLVEADAKIFDLTIENKRLHAQRKAPNVTVLRERRDT